MELSPTQKTKICYEFESFCKLVIHNERCDYFRQLQRRSEREIPFSELPPAILNGLGAADSSDVESCVFNVHGFEVTIRNEKLAEALLNLGAEGYSILLLAYSLGLSDREIAELLGASRSGIQRHRTQLLIILKDKMTRE